MKGKMFKALIAAFLSLVLCMSPGLIAVADNNYNSDGLTDGGGSGMRSITTTTEEELPSIHTGYIPDGIYSFKTKAHTNLWMDIRNNSTAVGTIVQQFDFDGTSPSIEYSASGLFKVTRVPGTGRYIIRLVMNNSRTIGFDSNDVVVKSISSNDSNVSASETFEIVYNNTYDAYTIKQYGTGNYVAANDEAGSGALDGNSSKLVKSTVSSITLKESWIIEGYSNTIPDGVYSFLNVKNTGRWLDVERDSMLSGMHMQQYAYPSNPTSNLASFPNELSRSGLYKITSDGSGAYVIRLMLNNLLSFGYSSTEVLTAQIPANDGSVLDSQKFKIVFYNGAYMLKMKQSPGYCVCAQNYMNSGADEAPESQMIKSAVTDAEKRGIWYMYRYTGADRSGVDVANRSVLNTSVSAQSPVYVTPSFWSTKTGSFTYDASLTTQFMGTMSKYLPVSLHLNIQHPGNTVFTLTLKQNGVTLATKSFTVRSHLNDTGESAYLLKNRQQTDYAVVSYDEINNDEIPDYSDGAMIGDFIGRDFQRWIFTLLDDGYYTIRTVSDNPDSGAASSVYLSVQSGYESSSNTKLILTARASSSAEKARQEWRVIYTANGSYKIKARSSEQYTSSDLVMDLNNAHTRLYQRAYNNNTSYNDEWLLEGVDNTRISLLGVNGTSSKTALNNVMGSLKGDGYRNVNRVYSSFDPSDMIGMMQESDIFAVRANGNGLIEGGYTSYSYLYTDTQGNNKIISHSGGYTPGSNDVILNNMPAGSFSNVNLAVIVSDRSALVAYASEPLPHNVAKALYDKGAGCAVGLNGAYTSNQENSFVQIFFEKLLDGNTAFEAANYAESVALSGGSNFIIYGDITFTLD